MLLPLYIIQDANPIWRAASWALALCLVAISLLFLHLTDGKPALRHFAPPFLYFLVAVPWPTAVEHGVVDLLTRLNTSVSIEALMFLGIPARQQGSVIELANTVVGIDEACSGIRSVQANLMLALFFGEYNRFTAARRVGLIALGFAFAIIFNLGRTLLLTTVAANQGSEAMNRWHDPAGVFVLLGCFTALYFSSRFLRSGQQLSALRSPLSSANSVTSCSNSFPSIGFSSFAPCALLFTLAAWGLMVPVLSEVWFRVHERNGMAEPVLATPWPPQGVPQSEEAPLSKSVRKQLAFDEGGSVRWRDARGNPWQMFYFRWLPAWNIFRRVEVQFAKSHRPEICLPASGRVLKNQSLVRLNIHGREIPFQFYTFEDRGRPLHVYLNVRDESMPIDSLANMRANTKDRLSAAWHGNRAAGQQTLQFAVWGIADKNESRQRVQQELPRFTAIP